ncbi:MAG: sugar-binding domain-containing protein [Verrucomicrobiota bacterium]
MSQTARSIDFNSDWQFVLGDPKEAQTPSFDSSKWRTLTVPHDWSIEQEYTQENAGGAGAFLPGGIGWYRKSFRVPESSKDNVIWIEFDGIYNNAEVWINGKALGMHPYGYTPFSYDLTEHLNFGDAGNVIAIRVDRSAYLDCRWYPGSGIYRDVKLVSVPKVHIPQWGTFITTPVATAEHAEVKVQTTVRNQDAERQEVELTTEIDGHQLSSKLKLDAGASEVVNHTIKIGNPKLWDAEQPYLYTAKSSLSNGHQAKTTFGIRDIYYNIDHGFFLNGKRTVFKGVCLHHDGGAVGAAVPDGVWVRRLEKLKALGCNAIRTAHNPPSEPFLNLCDRMGFLLQDEIFDEWDHPKDKRHNYNQLAASEETEGYTRYFREWEKRDTDAMMLRDRNHPSIVMWGIGNEVEWTYPGYTDSAGYWDKEQQAKGYSYYLTEPPFNDAKRKEIFEAFDRGEYELADTAARLAEYVRALDTTRPVTSNMVLPSISQFSGYAKVLDVDGYSYRQAVYEFGRKRSPDKLIIGTENWAQWSEWKPVLEHEWIAGIFLWPGISYLGEAKSWPQKASRSGLLDLAGFETPKAFYFKTLWTEEPLVHITSVPLSKSNYLVKDTGDIVEDPENPRESQWGWPELAEHWNHPEGEEIYVEVYSNAPRVELLLNGKSLGVVQQSDSEDRIFRWVTPFAAGELLAVARNGSDELARQRIQTSGTPAGIRLSVYEKDNTLKEGGVLHVTAELVDDQQRLVKHTESSIHFEVEGDARNIGVDNGDSFSVQPHKADEYETKNGRCLLILQPTPGAGSAAVIATAENLRLAKIRL